ncbi:MAG: glycosyltransferase [Hahellaceae bacterium]|nr:glycosyltransferase [Hahellaceae bacterium]MCP5213146.1 glycosyltransferase [Hahellaceae bacterium]
MKQSVLMIAFHYPPFSGSSGVQRTLRFSMYLPDHNWQPLVLSAHHRAYENVSKDLLGQIPNNVIYKPAFAMDSARHLSFKQKHLQMLAIPDRWITWLFGAVPSGVKLVKAYKPKCIWSTYPIATAHLIGYCLKKLTKLPWVADFRDPMVEQNPLTKEWTPKDRAVRRSRLWIERKTIENASRVIFCTEGAKNICQQRYPDADHSTWIVIPNGYDEETFVEVEKLLTKTKGGAAICPTKPFKLLHSGVLYNSPDRHPKNLFEAVSNLKSSGKIADGDFIISLRATGFDAEYKQLVASLGISNFVEFLPSIPYTQALREMMEMDGLLIFQGYTSNPAIPAKLYEYFRAKKPIFALADELGDTAKLLRSLGLDNIVPLDDTSQIEEGLSRFLTNLAEDKQTCLPQDKINLFSRKNQAATLANVLNSLNG